MKPEDIMIHGIEGPFSANNPQFYFSKEINLF